jgi:hypothetical protein
MTISAGAVAMTGGGALLVYAGLKGVSVPAALRSLISGGGVAQLQTTAAITTQAYTAFTGTTGSGAFTGGGSAAQNRALGQQMAAARGWTGGEWSALDQLWNAESGWRTTATNPSSGAYGIPQSLPADKMAAAGADWRTNPATQITWGLDYIAGRYGTPSAALAAWLARNPHWY